MKKTLKFILSMACILAMILPDAAFVLAETNEAQTAAKTIRIKEEEQEKDTDAEDLGPGERSEKDEENQVQEEDGNSEKSKQAPVERMDITEMTEIRVGTYEEWCDLAKKCSLDSWSVDKYVVLYDNIDFRMKTFQPIPLFAGVFEGNGYTLNKAAFTDGQNYIGVFSKTTPTAVIRDLNVIGVMKPDGKPFDIGGIVGDNSGMIANCKYDGYVEGYDYIGGIAGYNTETGIISACSVTGKITGLHHVGGISGANIGLVTGCSTKADVNTVTKDVETSIKDIKVEEVFTNLINKGKEEGNKMSIRSSNNPVDIGGIVGHNIGEVSSCTSESNVGYEHVGYNVGGIAGRQSGYVHDCINNGPVQGRKDVGGIVGQAEPYIKLDLNADIIGQISTAINNLHDSVDQTLKDTDASAGTVSARLNVIKGFADKALTDTGYLANSTQDYVNGVVGATNEIVGRIEYAVSESAADDGPVEDIVQAGTHLRDTASDLEKAVEDLDIYNHLSDTDKARYDDAKKKINDATKDYEEYYDYYMNDPAQQGARDTQYNTAQNDYIAQKHATDPAWPDNYNDLSEEQKAEVDVVASEAVQRWAVTQAKNDYKTDKGEEYDDVIADNTAVIADLVMGNVDKIVDSEKADAKKTASDIKKMATDLKDAGAGFRSILKDVSGRGAVRLPQLSEEYRLHTNSLVANIQGMSDNLGFLNNELRGSASSVTSDLEGVNDKFASLMLLFTDAMDGALEMDYSNVFNDESDGVCEDSVDATIAGCENRGRIYGDINTGGIAGTMAQEYDFDLEGDLTGIKNAAKKSTYRTKCVVRKDRNTGEVKGKKSYAGGCCGLQEMGTILHCSNYAKVSSESSDYVGGIAGRSYSTIRTSYEKGVLSGQTYIGGIAGAAVDITDCIAMPNVTEGTSFVGAIAGTADDSGKLSGNYFVSDTLAGVDRISIAGAAEPLTYGQLMAMDNVPADFSMLHVDFIVDDKVVATVAKKMGEVITPAETPIETDVATKSKNKVKRLEDEGKVELNADQYIDWDCDEEIPVYEDMEIKGEVTRYVGTLAGEQTGAGKQSVLLVDGRFVKGDKLEISKIPTSDSLVEEYEILIPGDGGLTHLVRYQQQDPDNVTIYQKIGDEYVELKQEMFGQYITFEVSGNEVQLKFVKDNKIERVRPIRRIIFIVIGFLILLVIIKVIHWIFWKRSLRRNVSKGTVLIDTPDIENLEEDSDDAT